MHGNIFEWCDTSIVDYPTKDGLRKGESISDDESRVLRGGSFGYLALVVRSAYRYDFFPVLRLIYFGFRLARTYN